MEPEKAPTTAQGMPMVVVLRRLGPRPPCVPAFLFFALQSSSSRPPLVVLLFPPPLLVLLFVLVIPPRPSFLLSSSCPRRPSSSSSHPLPPCFFAHHSSPLAPCPSPPTSCLLPFPSRVITVSLISLLFIGREDHATSLSGGGKQAFEF